MAGITMSGTEDKRFQTQRPAADGYSYSVGAVPNKGLANSGANMKNPGTTNTPPANSRNNPPSVSAPAEKTYSTTDIPGVYTGGGNSGVKVTVKSGAKAQAAETPVANTPAGPSAQQQAETAHADLRNQYASQIRNQSDYAADKMKAERDEALRENWILQQQAEAALPEQMAARGVNGGATETTLANLRAQYQGNRNDIRGGYMEEMGDLAQSHNQQQAEGNRSYNERWLDYLMDLAKMDEQYKRDLALRQMG